MPLPTGPKPWSFYRLGPTKEKELFKRHRETYDGIVIPAHIASYYYKFCSEFIGSLGKPYFIDPMTYIFANNPIHLKRFVKDRSTGRTVRDPLGRKRKGDVKRSYFKLIEQDYQGVVKVAVDEGRSLVPSDFANSTYLNHFVQKVLDFQKTRLATIPDKYKKYEKYAQKAGKKMSASGNTPMCLIAPYFPTTTLQATGWHARNLQLIQQAKSMAGDIPIFAVILASTQVLSQSVKQISMDYSASGADGFLLWPDGFSSNQDLATLRVVFNSIKELSKDDKPVILMYGGAFSLTLSYAGLTGFVSGICYGERKLSTDDVDLEGGISPRYYIRRLKKKVIIETEARRIQINNYPDLTCDCLICQRKPDPVNLNETESREHFMLARAEEMKELRGGLSQEDFVQSLEDAFQKYRYDPLLQPIGYLRNWISLLKGKNSV